MMAILQFKVTEGSGLVSHSPQRVRHWEQLLTFAPMCPYFFFLVLHAYLNVSTLKQINKPISTHSWSQMCFWCVYPQLGHIISSVWQTAYSDIQ